jgi:hypothetical protein
MGRYFLGIEVISQLEQDRHALQVAIDKTHQALEQTLALMACAWAIDNPSDTERMGRRDASQSDQDGLARGAA